MKPIHLLSALVLTCCLITFPARLLQNLYAQTPKIEPFTVQTEAMIQEHVGTAVLDTLVAYNQGQVGNYIRKPFSIYVKDNYGRVIAGVTGVALVNYDCIVQLVAVDPAHRRQGWGRKLLQELDKFARANNCNNIRLETADFQARGFYEKMGYQKVAEMDNSFLGHKVYIMRKDLLH
jgi:ribosomal protein S18 acetylase RimI-like enzyme